MDNQIDYNVKNRKIREKQLYKCLDCGKQYTNSKQDYKDYVLSKQTLQQLADKYNLNVSTIRRRFTTVKVKRYVSEDNIF